MEDELPWKYPRGYWCKKCHNTGYKLKNGRSCKDCWRRFARQNNVEQLPPISSGFRIPFTPFTIPDLQTGYVSSQPYNPQNTVYPQTYRPAQQQNYHPQISQAQPSTPGKQFQTPSDDPPPYSEIDNAEPAQGLAQQARPPQHPSQQYRPPAPPAVHYPPPIPAPMTPRFVKPGDPSIGGVLCGRCRGTGLIHDFFLDEEYCNVCKGVGRVFRR